MLSLQLFHFCPAIIADCPDPQTLAKLLSGSRLAMAGNIGVLVNIHNPDNNLVVSVDNVGLLGQNL